MCGRFTLTAPRRALKDVFPLFDVPDLPPRYNVAPSQPILALRCSAESGNEAVWLRWGLIPHWADDPAAGNRLINARCESAAQKPAFRSSFRRRRCLVPADGFFEWRKANVESAETVRQGTLFGDENIPQRRRIPGRGVTKQPYYIRLRDGRPFAFAGLWESWAKQGERIESCTILTTDANDLVRPLHDRMPVILRPEHYALWLDPANDNVDSLQPLLAPYPADQMMTYPVSTHINDPKHDDVSCIAPFPRQ
jgi:putative SOS response-associated peptidase YedK